MEHLVRELVNLGLSEKEADVYLALLELSPAPVQDVAEKAGVNRTTTYLLVDVLAKRGIVSSTMSGKKQLYVAEPPERLVTLLRLQRQELEEKERELMRTIPLLNAVYDTKGDKPRIQYFEGPESVAQVREILLAAEGECLQIVPLDESEAAEDLLRHRPDHFARLEKQRMPIKGLMVMKDPDPSKVPVVPNAEMRVISAAEFPIRAEITVRGDVVLLSNYRPKLLSIVITSRHFADTFRTLFNLAWKSAK